MLLVVVLEEGQDHRAWGTNEILTGCRLNLQSWTLGKNLSPLKPSTKTFHMAHQDTK